MVEIHVGMEFSCYSMEFSGYDKYSSVHGKRGYYRQGSVYTTKEKHVHEVNCFNQKDLSFDEMMTNSDTVRFNYERYCDNYGEHYQYEMNRNGLKYTGSYENKFDRIESADAYAVDLNNNGKVDEGEIFSKNKNETSGKITFLPWVREVFDKKSEIIPVDSPLGKELSRSANDLRQADLEYEPIYSDPNPLGQRELIGYKKKSKTPKWL